jgi:hypothetical protein
MSRHQLVDAYVSGQIGRRAFVRGLVALGMSASAAAAYAAALNPAEAAPIDDDFYVPPAIRRCLGLRGFRAKLRCIIAALLRTGGNPMTAQSYMGGKGKKGRKHRNRKRK